MSYNKEDLNLKIKEALDLFSSLGLKRIMSLIHAGSDAKNDTELSDIDLAKKINISTLKNLLSQLEGSESLDTHLSRRIFHTLKDCSSSNAEDVADIMKLWMEKADLLVYNPIEDIINSEDFCDENIRFTMLKTLFKEKILSIRRNVWDDHNQENSHPILRRVLRGFASKGNILAPNSEFLCYMLENGAGADLVTCMDVLYWPYCSTGFLKLPELVSLWNILKEEREKSNSEITEEDGGKIAELYLDCEKNKIGAAGLLDNKAQVLECFNSPHGFKGLVASCVKDCELNKQLWKELEVEAKPLDLAKVLECFDPPYYLKNLIARSLKDCTFNKKLWKELEGEAKPLGLAKVLECFVPLYGPKDLITNHVKENFDLNEKFWKEIEPEPRPDLAKIKRLLEEAPGIGCYPLYQPHGDNGDKFLSKLLDKVDHYQAGELQEIAKLWAEKRGKSNCAKALFHILTRDNCNEEAPFEIIKGLVSVAGVRDQVFVIAVEKFLPALALTLAWFPSGGTDYVVNLEILKYFLTHGAGVDLVTCMEGLYSHSRSSGFSKVAELVTLLDIIKEERSKRGSEITPEDSEKIAKLYLDCEKNSINSEWLLSHKAEVLESFNSPSSLADLSNGFIKSFLKEERDVDNLPLSPPLKTLVEEAVVSLPTPIQPLEGKNKQQNRD